MKMHRLVFAILCSVGMLGASAEAGISFTIERLIPNAIDILLSPDAASALTGSPSANTDKLYIYATHQSERTGWMNGNPYSTVFNGSIGGVAVEGFSKTPSPSAPTPQYLTIDFASALSENDTPDATPYKPAIRTSNVYGVYLIIQSGHALFNPSLVSELTLVWGSDGLGTTEEFGVFQSSALTGTKPPPPTVPEPSTAIAMGLLGIVGFAGNRRRRRQESVA